MSHISVCVSGHVCGYVENTYICMYVLGRKQKLNHP